MKELTIWAYLLPSGAALLYALGNLGLKRAFNEGAGVMRVAFVCNVVLGLGFLVLLPLVSQPTNWALWWAPLVAGGLFFAGQALTFAAMRAGHVSVQAPVMGIKVIFVALLASAFAGEELGWRLWAASGLSSFAVILLGFPPKAQAQGVLKGALMAMGSALLFAACDVWFGYYAAAFGPVQMGMVCMGFNAVLSLALLPTFRAPLWAMPALCWRWLGVGCGIITVQAIMLYYAIAVPSGATLANILYSARGFWGIVLVWSIGHWFANAERQVGPAVMIRRLIGALLLMGAIGLSLG